MVTVVQENLQHNEASSVAICQHFRENIIDIALIQEPRIHRGRIGGLEDAKRKQIYFNSRGITTVQVGRLNKGEKQGHIMSSIYIPFDARSLSPTMSLTIPTI